MGSTALLQRGTGLRGWAARHRAAACVLAYTAGFALLMVVWIGIFAANGKSFIWYADTIEQHYPALVYYGRWLRQAAHCLLTGAAIPTWDMSIGYGADVIDTLSYYVIGDPLNLLAALVPSSLGELLLEFLIVLRLYLGGLAFTAYSLHHRNSGFGTVLGAIAYTFSAWTLQTSTTEPIFLIPLYCFPLLLLGADDLFEGRNALRYMAAVALAALSNFLFFYMMAVLLVGYAVVRYLRMYGVKQLRSLWPLLGKFIACSLVGIAISAVTMLPTALEMTSGARFAVDRKLSPYPFTELWTILANLGTGAKIDGYSTFCGISAVAVLAVLVMFSRKGRHTTLKVTWLVLLAFMVIPLAGKVLNGFSYAQNRWVWAFVLLEAFILARVCPELTQLVKGERSVLFALLTGYLLLSFWNRDVRTEWAMICTVLLLLLAVAVLCLGGESGQGAVRAVLLGGCCLGVIINLGYNFGADEGETLLEYDPPGYAWDVSVKANPANLLKQLDDPTLWRYDTAMNVPINSNMLMDLHGVNYFFSLNNSGISRWMTELGWNSPTEYTYEGLQGRSVMNVLTGAKYFLTATDSTDTLPPGYAKEPVLALDVAGVNVGAYLNEAALPIGYTAAQRITRADYDAMSPVQRQDVLLNGVLLEDAADSALPVAAPQTDVVIPQAEIALNNVEKVDDTTYYSAQDGGTITLTVSEPVANCETYLVVQGMDYTATNPYKAIPAEELAAKGPAERLALSKQYAFFWCKESVYLCLISDIGEGRIDYAMRNNQYYCGRHDFAYNFGVSDTGMTTCTIVLPFAGYYSFDRIDIECQQTGTVAHRAAALSEESLQGVVLGTNSISGTISSDSTKVLVLQIPYSSGWQVFVDDAPATLLQANSGFLGVELGEGEHTVLFRYHTPGLAAGAACSVAGLLVFLGYAGFLIFRKHRKV